MQGSIVYASDDHYASLAGVSMISLFRNNRDFKLLNVYILADQISKKNIARLKAIGEKYHRNVYILDVDRQMQHLMENGVEGYANAVGGKGLTAFSRLFISELLPDVERVVYLDCDTLVRGSLKELFTMDLHGKPIAMAFDCLHNLYKKYINVSLDMCYYNSGVMVIDVQQWKDKNCLDRILDHLQHVRNNYPLVDQDFINVVLGQDITLMDMKYNYLSQYCLYDYESIKDVYGLKPPYFWKNSQWVRPDQAVVLHFCGQTFGRPWFKNSKHPYKKVYDRYYNISPWKNVKQQECRIPPQYKVQYILWRYMPKKLQAAAGVLMQKIFMKLTYKVQNSIGIRYKIKMFTECMKKYVENDMVESRLYKKFIIADPDKRHSANIAMGIMFVPVSLFRHGLGLFYRIFCREQVIFPYFEIVVTTKCSLRCRHCANLMQYYESPYNLQAESVLDSIKRVMAIADGVIIFRIIGGEPFLYKELDKVVEHLLSYKNIYRIGIPTNGTVSIHNKKLLGLLKNRRISIDVSDYGYSENGRKFCDLLEQNEIRYGYTNTKWWFDMGDLMCRNREPRQLQDMYKHCYMVCRDILNGKIFQCPRSAHGTDLGFIISPDSDWFDLKEYGSGREAKEKLVQFYWKEHYVEACNYCDMGMDGNRRAVPAGEQCDSR